MSTSTLNHGALGRCACGAIGRRRKPFNGEPICPKCMPMRTGPVCVLTPREANALICHEISIGKQTRAQREARKALLR